jgi:site-specific recombinase XerD
VYLLSVAGLIACKDVSLFEAFSCPWTPSLTFYKLLEIERGRKDRLVYLSADALAALRTCLTARPTVVPEGLVFWNQKRPHRTLSAKGIQKKIERYAKAAGIKASCHSLRHTFASNLLEAGAEVISIKELLGHASIKSSERYAKLSNQRVKQVYQQTMRKVIAKTRV